MRTLTPEQRARKQQADRDRRAAKKAGTFTPKQAAHAAPAEPPVPAPAPPVWAPRRAAKAPEPAATTEGVMAVVTFRATERQKRLFQAAGGGAWLRGVLDAGEASGHIKLGS